MENKLKMDWYMITVISGKENQILESLKNRVVSENLTDSFDLNEGFMIMKVPYLTAREFEKKANNEPFKVREKNMFPGYIFVKMRMTNEAWFMVRNTQYVTGLVGSSGQGTKPTPIPASQIEQMIKKCQKKIDEFNSGKIKSPFVKGVVVEIIDGPFKGNTGPISENDDEHMFAMVELELFNRITPTKIEYKDLKIQK